GRAARLARAGDRCRNPPRRRCRHRASGPADRLRFRTFGNAGRARYRLWPSGERGWRAALSAAADSRGGGGFHRRPRPARHRGGGWRRRDPSRRRAATLPRRIRSLRLRSGGMSVLIGLFPWIKALHLLSVIAWMAGLLYLPRLFVYHAAARAGSETSETFKVMERRLLRGIMTPALIGTLLFGGLLAATPGAVDWSRGWIYV